MSGDIDEVHRLLAAGANPCIANREGKTPLETASLFGYSKIRHVLENYRA